MTDKAQRIVIVVDDDINIRTSLHEYLTAELYNNMDVRVVECADGAAAISYIDNVTSNERLKICAVLIDKKMPGVAGVEVLKHYRLVAPTIPCLMLTAADDEFDEAVGLAAGAADYITKPFSQRLLAERIRSAVRRSSGLADIHLHRDGRYYAFDDKSILSDEYLVANNTALLADVTKSLLQLSEFVKGDNGTLGLVLKEQLISTIRVILAELEGSVVDRQVVDKKAKFLNEVGRQIADEAVEKGVGTVIQESASALVSFLSNLSSGSG